MPADAMVHQRVNLVIWVAEQQGTSASAPEKRAQRAHRFRGPVRHPRETNAQVLAAPTCASALGAVEGVKIGGRAASFGSRLGRI